jgi:hypothetical protein
MAFNGRSDLGSLICEGLGLSTVTLNSLGLEKLARIDNAAENVPLYQVVRLVMQGASDQEVSEMAAYWASLTRMDVFDELRRLWDEVDLVRVDPKVTGVPTLFLDPQLPLINYADMRDAFLRFVPDAQVDELDLWPGQMTNPEAGRELANKIVAFVDSLES